MIRAALCTKGSRGHRLQHHNALNSYSVGEEYRREESSAQKKSQLQEKIIFLA